MSCLNEIESYFDFFKKKRKFQSSNIEGIKNILNSQKYSNFIEKLCKHYNSKAQLKENFRLSRRYYQELNQDNDCFWELLLGNKSINKFISNQSVIVHKIGS